MWVSSCICTTNTCILARIRVDLISERHASGCRPDSVVSAGPIDNLQNFEQVLDRSGNFRTVVPNMRYLILRQMERVTGSGG